MNRASLIDKVGRYYAATIDRHGATPRGVDWNSEESQRLRFEQLAKLWGGSDPRGFSVLDYGCGYGALLQYLRDSGLDPMYAGFDISSEMIVVAKRLHPDGIFHKDPSTLSPVDYVVGSGLFNVKLDTPEREWSEYLLETLDRMFALARIGLAFNVLTSYSQPEKRRGDLYYADPRALFDYCKTRFSRFVSVLHDYPLYEFTILVRRER